MHAILGLIQQSAFWCGPPNSNSPRRSFLWVHRGRLNFAGNPADRELSSDLPRGCFRHLRSDGVVSGQYYWRLAAVWVRRHYLEPGAFAGLGCVRMELRLNQRYGVGRLNVQTTHGLREVTPVTGWRSRSAKLYCSLQLGAGRTCKQPIGLARPVPLRWPGILYRGPGLVFLSIGLACILA